MTIEQQQVGLPNGMHLSCRTSGARDRPLLVFLHGFPEGAFVWDTLLEHFSAPEHGGFRCVAPNLRGFERSDAPVELEAYKPGPMIQDVMQLAQHERADGRIHALVAHDWGGAIGWSAAHAHPDKIGRLVIVNSPHPATFARDLKNDPNMVWVDKHFFSWVLLGLAIGVAWNALLWSLRPRPAPRASAGRRAAR